MKTDSARLKATLIVALVGLLALAAVLRLGRTRPAGSAALATSTAHAQAATRQAAALTESASFPQSGTPPAHPPSPPLDDPEAAVFQPIPGGVPAGDGAIIEVAPPFSSADYHILNEWYQDLDGGQTRLMVFAGSVAGPGGTRTDQGVVVVRVWRMALRDGAALPETVESLEYHPAAAAGPLRVIAAAGQRLTLETPDGRQLFFDVAARQFLD